MYYVSRQIRWPDGAHLVEIVRGGRDQSSPGALESSPKYRRLGDGQEFKDPREAVEAAIAVCRAWREVPRQRGEWPRLAGYATLDGLCSTDAVTFEEARAWAREEWEGLEKCGCGDPLPPKRERWRADDWSGQEFCSQSCAEREIEWQEKFAAELAAEEEASDAEEAGA